MVSTYFLESIRSFNRHDMSKKTCDNLLLIMLKGRTNKGNPSSGLDWKIIDRNGLSLDLIVWRAISRNDALIVGIR